jgi:hypothetical protein
MQCANDLQVTFFNSDNRRQEYGEATAGEVKMEIETKIEEKV